MTFLKKKSRHIFLINQKKYKNKKNSICRESETAGYHTLASPTTNEGTAHPAHGPSALGTLAASAGCRRGHAQRQAPPPFRLLPVHLVGGSARKPKPTSPPYLAAVPVDPDPTPPTSHHLTAAPPQPVASPSRAPCRLAAHVREPAGYPNPSILGSAVEEHWGRERGSHQPS